MSPLLTDMFGFVSSAFGCRNSIFDHNGKRTFPAAHCVDGHRELVLCS